MKHLSTTLLTFWVMWSGTTVTKELNGGLVFNGGIYLHYISDVIDLRGAKPGEVLWHRADYFDTKLLCEKEVEQYKETRQLLLCLPEGTKPRRN